MSRRSLVRDEQGAALIEAALVLPILILVLFALVDLSLYFWTWSSAGKAVQLGARRAAVSRPVAVGPGLVRDLSLTYWDNLVPGTGCEPSPGSGSACPVFDVRCRGGGGCVCEGGRCAFTFSPASFAPLLSAMRAALPNLQAENVEIRYATNGLGYVGEPAPVPVDVTVSLVDFSYRPLLLPDLLGNALRLEAFATVPSEALGG